MAFDLGSAALGALDTGLNMVSNIVTNKINSKEQFKYQSQLMKQQNDWNLEMWNRNNDYNSPDSVVRRLLAAGLNPSMVLSNSGSVTSASAAPSAASGSVGLGTPYSSAGTDFMNSYLANQSMKADVELKEAQADAARAEAERTGQDSALKQAQTTYQNTLNKWADLSEEERINNLKASYYNLVSSTSLNESKKQEIEEGLPFIAQLNQAQLDNLDKQLEKVDAEILTEVAKRYNLSASSAQALSAAALNNKLGNVAEAERLLKIAQEENTRTDTNAKSKIIGKNAAEALSAVEDLLEKRYNNAYRSIGFDPKGSPINNFVTLMRSSFTNITSPVADKVKELNSNDAPFGSGYSGSHYNYSE